MKSIAGTTLLLAAIAFLGITPCRSQDSSTHAAATIEFLTLMNVEEMLDQAIEASLSSQLQANPDLKPYEGVMRTFIEKYMSWGNLKEQFVVIYMQEFTESDLRTMVRFYRTEVGRKAIEKLPILLAKGSELGRQAVQSHLSELTEAIQKRDAELKQNRE